jgi:acylaminoacyl-peptidase
MPNYLRARPAPGAALGAALVGASLVGAALAGAQPAGVRPAPARRAITFADFAAVRAVSDPQLSPDGRTVLYAVRTTDVEANRRATRTYAAPAAGGAPRAWPDSATPPPRRAGAPTGRGGVRQRRPALGGRRRRRQPPPVTRLNGGAGGPGVGPVGDVVLVTSAVWPACTGARCPTASTTAATRDGTARRPRARCRRTSPTG